MKIDDIRQMKLEELHSELDRLRRHVFDLRTQAVTEKLQDPSMLTRARRDIARILTELRARGETAIEQKQYHLETVAASKKRTR